jgi:ParB-like chromosome segregation protein Spo0J
MPQHVPKPGAGDTRPRGVRIADGEYGSPITSQCMPVDKIRIGKRHRLDLGDIAGLAESIEDVGLLHPITVDQHGHLLAGARRLAAYKWLGRTEIPVNIVSKRS